MASQTRATVIIVTFDSARYISACLRSVCASLPALCDVVLVDNSSTDGTVDVVRANFPAVQILENQVNRGFGAANNQGAAIASGGVLVFLNPDTIVTPGWIEALIAPLERQQCGTIGATTARISMLKTPAVINACGNEVHISGMTTCRGLGTRGDDPRYLAASEVHAISGACFALQAATFRRIGGFDERFFLYLEDTHLSLRLRLAGLTCYYTPSSIVYHDYEPRHSARRLYHVEQNRLLMLASIFPRSVLVALTPSLLLTEALAWVFAASLGRPGLIAKWRSYGKLRQNLLLPIGPGEGTQTNPRAQRELFSSLNLLLAADQLTGPFFGRALALITAPFFALSRFLGCAVLSSAVRQAGASSSGAVPSKE